MPKPLIHFRTVFVSGNYHDYFILQEHVKMFKEVILKKIFNHTLFGVSQILNRGYMTEAQLQLEFLKFKSEEKKDFDTSKLKIPYGLYFNDLISASSI